MSSDRANFTPEEAYQQFKGIVLYAFKKFSHYSNKWEDDLISAGQHKLWLACLTERRNDPDFLPFATVLVKRAMIDELRTLTHYGNYKEYSLHEKAYAQTDEYAKDWEEVFVSNDMDTRDAVIMQDEREILKRAMRALPKTYREVLRMYFFKEMDMEEIGQSFGYTKVNTSVKIHRALEHLRKHLKKRGMVVPRKISDSRLSI